MTDVVVAWFPPVGLSHKCPLLFKRSIFKVRCEGLLIKMLTVKPGAAGTQQTAMPLLRFGFVGEKLVKGGK